MHRVRTLLTSGGCARCAMAAAAITLFACAEVPVLPQVPALALAELAPEHAGELFVLIRPALGPDRLIRWTIAVDGKVRAILPQAEAYTRIAVPPGERTITVGYRMHSVLSWLPAPIGVPARVQQQVELVVPCAPHSRCGVVVVEQPPSPGSGSRLSARLLSAHEIDQALQAVPFRPADAPEPGPVSSPAGS